MKLSAIGHGPFTRVLNLLKGSGFIPGAIIDIGVATGTTGLYDVWPDVPGCLIEPSPKARAALAGYLAERPHLRMFPYGASNRTAEVAATEHTDMPYVAIGNHKPKWSPLTVTVRPCDDIVREGAFAGPFIYKLDTDTHDREALEGSEWTLSQSAVVLVELNVFGRFRQVATPDFVWRFLADRGFTLFDVCRDGVAANGLLRCADFVFIREDHAAFRWAYENCGKAAKTLQPSQL
jgi:FkbM family methyltransferase